MRGKFQAVPGISYCLLGEPVMSSAGLREICADVSSDCIPASSPAKGLLIVKDKVKGTRCSLWLNPMHIIISACT